MADPDAEDDDLSAIDDDSRDMLEADVKKGKARKFILVCKGAQIRSLVVFKKGPYGPRINRTRKSGFRGEFYCGVVTGKGVNLNLQLPGTAAVSEAMKAEGNVYDDAPCKIAKLRAFFAEEAGLKFKPEISIVTALNDVAVVDETDGQDTAADASNTASATSASAATDDNAAASTSDAATKEDPLKQKLLEALSKMTPLIKSAIATAPNRKGELLQQAAGIRNAIEGGELNDAKQDLLNYGALLKQIAGASNAAAPTAPPENAGDQNAAEYDRRLKEIMPELKTALSAGGQAANEVKAKAAEAQSLRKQGQLPAALGALDELEALIGNAQAAQAKDVAAQASAAKWEQRLQQIEPRYQKAIGAEDNDNAKKLRVLFTYATEQAEAQQYAKALAALDRLEPILQDAEAETEEETEETEEEDVVKTGSEDFDAFRKCLSRWNAAISEVRGQIGKLKSAALEKFPDAAVAVDRLDEVFDGLDLRLEGVLGEGLSAPSAEQREAVAKRVRAIADKYRSIVESNPIIEHADANPFGVSLSVEETLRDPLEAMESQLEEVA